MAKALIVGGGIAGLSSAWALARRGFAVELFEQGPLPNSRSSSYDEHRIIRHAYGEMEGYAHLMPEAFATWERLWRETGRRHFESLPALYILREDDDAGWYEPAARSLGAMHIGFRDIPLDDAPRLLPMVNLDGASRLVETEGAGMLFPSRILTDLVLLLARLGVRLHADARVQRVDPERGTLRADGHEHGGDVVVVAAGAWADRLVPGLRGVAVPSRQAVIYLAPPPELVAAWDAAPVIIDFGRHSRTYTLPPRQGTRLKVGDHIFTRRGDPDEDRAATDADADPLWAAAQRTYRGLDRYAVLERRACFYTVTEDERFILRPIGPRGWVCSACSGHGFKLGALMGEAVARGVAGDVVPAHLADWAAGRIVPGAA
ncbi:MAG TPA: FAD-dependent oxidoreductase [Acetobacteraceae bacterium]|jgi:sarcosine oxidase/sarcosine oxidase subunit beta|nr:FAD-dependent oxidoreductase [Acetobacteraceae bacterium]